MKRMPVAGGNTRENLQCLLSILRMSVRERGTASSSVLLGSFLLSLPYFFITMWNTIRKAALFQSVQIREFKQCFQYEIMLPAPSLRRPLENPTYDLERTTFLVLQHGSRKLSQGSTFKEVSLEKEFLDVLSIRLQSPYRVKTWCEYDSVDVLSQLEIKEIILCCNFGKVKPV